MRVHNILALLALTAMAGIVVEAAASSASSASSSDIAKKQPVSNSADDSHASTAMIAEPAEDVVALFDHPVTSGEITDLIHDHISDMLELSWEELRASLHERIRDAINTRIMQALEERHPLIARVLKKLTDEEREIISRAITQPLLEYARNARDAFKDAAKKIIAIEVSRFLRKLIERLRAGAAFDQATRMARTDFAAAVRESFHDVLGRSEDTLSKSAPDEFFQSLTRVINKDYPAAAGSLHSVEDTIRPVIGSLIVELTKQVFGLLRTKVDAAVLDTTIGDILRSKASSTSGAKQILP